MARELMIRFTYAVQGGSQGPATGGSATMVVGSDGTALPVAAGRLLGVALDRDGDAWRLSITPSVDVEIGACTATMRLDLASFDAVYHNGYQSWTDSIERRPAYTMPGLAFAPGIAVRNWALDGSGDYRFAHYEPTLGFQHGFGYCWARRGEHYLFVGSLSEDLGLTTTYTSLRRGTLTLEREAPARIIRAGETREILSFALLEGGLDECLDAWLAYAGVRAIPAPGLVGFSSWYRHYDDIDQPKLLHDLEATKRLFAGVDTGDCQRVFQIDDGYATVGDWLQPHEERFPDGMAAMAQRICEAGFVPGLWMAPFVCSADSLLFRYHPDWLLRDDSGATVMTGSHWNGAYALDTLNPEVREYVRESLGTATREWGYRLLKLDFLYGACMLPHGGMNRGELMADAISLLRGSVDDGVVFDMCGVPLMSAFGRTEYCRIGCDVGLDWDDALYMRALHRERVSTKNSLANTRGRAHLDGRVFRNDPDVFFLRDDVKLTNEQRASLLEADSTLGGVFFTSDDVEAWSPAATEAWRAALARFVERNPFFAATPTPVLAASTVPSEQVERLSSELDEVFGPHAGARAFVCAPGRTEIAGNHTDHEGGHVIAGAVDRYLYGVAAHNGLDCIRVSSAGYAPFEVRLSSLDPVAEEKGTSAAIVRGLASGMAGRGMKPEGFDLVLESEVPAGSGLSSSAAFELAIARTMDILWGGNDTPSLELALLSQKAEREWFGKPCGLMDQASVALGGIQHMSFGDDVPRTDRIDFDFSAKGYAICLVAVGESHADLIDEYAAVPGEMQAVARALGGERLSDVIEDDVIDELPRLREELGDRAVLRALHFFREERLTGSRAHALRMGDIDAFLELTRESGISSSTLLQNVSAPTVHGRDQAAMIAIAFVDELFRDRGACRIHGGGFGGTVQAFVPLRDVEWFRSKMDKVYGDGACMVCGIDHEGAKAVWL